MATLTNLPPWTVEYTYNVAPSQKRTNIDSGFKRQVKSSHRKVTLADVSRRLQLSELPYFEWFIRGIANDGADKFIDSYIDQGGLQSGDVRVVGGEYTVQTNTRSHLVTCQLEIFR